MKKLTWSDDEHESCHLRQEINLLIATGNLKAVHLQFQCKIKAEGGMNAGWNYKVIPLGLKTKKSSTHKFSV